MIINCFALIHSPTPFKEIQRREEMLQPLYTQVACEYADLHDRAGRMKAVGAVRESLLEKKSVRDNRNDDQKMCEMVDFIQV